MRLVLLFGFACLLGALERPGVEFKIFQFPANRIPTIDGKAADWSIVPDSYAIGTDESNARKHTRSGSSRIARFGIPNGVARVGGQPH